MPNGRSPTVHGDGRQPRDFTYVDNVVQANLLAAKAPGVSGKVYNVACGKSTSLLDLIAALNRLMSASVWPVYTVSRPGDLNHSLPDAAPPAHHLAYPPPLTLPEWLRPP